MFKNGVKVEVNRKKEKWERRGRPRVVWDNSKGNESAEKGESYKKRRRDGELQRPS